MSYAVHSLGASYLSAEMQSVYSTAPAGWAGLQIVQHDGFYYDCKVAFVKNKANKLLKYWRTLKNRFRDLIQRKLFSLSEK